jgi:hypothetical protein
VPFDNLFSHSLEIKNLSANERCVGLQRRGNRLQGWKEKETENLRWFSIRIFPFDKIGNWVRCKPVAPGRGRRRVGVGDPSTAEIAKAIELNDAFVDGLERLRDKAIAARGGCAQY